MSLNGDDNEKEHLADPIKADASATDKRDNKQGTSKHSSARFHTLLNLIATFLLLVWPWILFGIIWAKNGIQLDSRDANVVMNNPHVVNFLVTFVGTLVSMAVSFFFASAVVRLDWQLYRGDVTVFHIMALSGITGATWPWGIGESLKHLAGRPKRWLVAALIAACWGAFTFVSSGTTSLITPVPFTRNVTLQGTELDLASNDPDCLAWFAETTIPNQCDYQSFNGLEYTNCLGENQLVDVLESGRGNILSQLPNNSQSLTFSQLSSQGGLHLLGPIRGILPIGPNGVPAFNTLQDSPLSDSEELAAMLSYNYTLENQGFISNVTCSYEPTSGVAISPVSSTEEFVFQYNGSCDGATQVLTNVKQYITVNSNNTLTFWACKSTPNGTTQPNYSIYLRGVAGYESSIGNITCNVSPIQPATFPVTYQSVLGIFNISDSIAINDTTFSGFIDRAMVGLGDIIWESQDWESNLVAESVFTFGVKDFGQLPYVQNEQYLQLFEAMIQGMLEYQATYIRLIYSTGPGRPASCTRTVTGSVSYQALGWSVQPEHIGFLLPMTIINLLSFILLLITIYKDRQTNDDLEEIDRTDPLELLRARPTVTGHDEGEWSETVRFRGWHGDATV